jgi:hypothetical protein
MRWKPVALMANSANTLIWNANIPLATSGAKTGVDQYANVSFVIASQFACANRDTFGNMMAQMQLVSNWQNAETVKVMNGDL